MGTLRRHLGVATAALLSLQVGGTVLGFVTWWRVQEACMLQQRIGSERESLLELARTARELYVHQAHTFIEGGAGHLDHLAEDAAHVEAALVEAGDPAGPLPVDVRPIRAAVARSNAWFTAEVAPRARAGSLDRPTAAALHQTAEAHAAAVQAAIETSLAALNEAQRVEVERVSVETERAWVAIAMLVIGGLGLGFVVSTRLARSILTPVDALRQGVRTFAARGDVHVPTSGPAELAELGVAFNEMVARVRAAESRLVERERVQALGEIAGAVAHELMSPIGAILGETRAEPIDGARIRAEADHARRVIQGLLGYARPGEAEPSDVRVDEAAIAAVERAVPFADSRGIDLVWRGGPATNLHAGPTAVRQVLDNLIRNAVEAAPPGTVEVRVAGGAVEVLDRGAGLPPAVRARLYEPFVTGRPDGTGLGLAVSQRIAHALGGRIVHLDRTGGGTVARWELSHG